MDSMDFDECEIVQKINTKHELLDDIIATAQNHGFDVTLDETMNIETKLKHIRSTIEKSCFCPLQDIEDSKNYSCPSCGSKQVEIIERIVRSADEGSIMELNCKSCGRKHNI